MLQAIVEWSARNRVVVVVLAALLLVLGVYAAGNARLDVFPEFAPPEVTVQTEAPGLSPGEVEQIVTGPVESAVNGLPRARAPSRGCPSSASSSRTAPTSTAPASRSASASASWAGNCPKACGRRGWRR